MSSMENPELIFSLECFIDSNTLQDALQLLETICWEKAHHILSNWQDKATAESWEKAALAIERVSASKAVSAVSEN
jgi:hypothetical protein